MRYPTLPILFSTVFYPFFNFHCNLCLSLNAQDVYTKYLNILSTLKFLDTAEKIVVKRYDWF